MWCCKVSALTHLILLFFSCRPHSRYKSPQMSSEPSPPPALLAGQPDIVRSSQKDRWHIHALFEELANAYSAVFGTVSASRWTRELELLADVAYFAMTTASGSKTLGEEYCDIVPVDAASTSRTGRAPLNETAAPASDAHAKVIAVATAAAAAAAPLSKRKRWLFVFLHSCLPYILDKLLQKLHSVSRPVSASHPNAALREKYLYSLPLGLGALLRHFVPLMHRSIPILRDAIEGLHRAHLALFYFTGLYSQLTKRTLYIRYIMTRDLGIGETRPSYHMLGLLSSVQLFITLLLWLKPRVAHLLASRRRAGADGQDPPRIRSTDSADVDADQNEESAASSSEDITEAAKCTLCLGARENTTATPCGHLFCWKCIAEWCTNKPECPLCRQPASLSKLCCVYNYGL